MNFDLRCYGIVKIGIVALTVLMVAFSWLDPIDTQATQQVESGVKRSLITFATARALNGVISVVQGTEVSAKPFGFGLTLSVGQVLDPVNDLIEKFSNLMLFACIAFGIQKVLLAVGSSWLISVVFSIVAGAWCYLYLVNKSRPNWLTRTVVILVIARFAIPVALVGSGLIFDGFLKPTYDRSHMAIQSVSKDLAASKDAIAEETTSNIQDSTGDVQKKPGFFTGLFGQKKENSTPSESGSGDTSATQQTAIEKQSLWSKINPKKRIDNLKVIVEDSTESFIDLMVVFVLQTILLPLFLIWIFISILKGSYGVPNDLLRRNMSVAETPNPK